MKKTVALVFGLLLTVVSYAQKDVTKFLGIPVDGTKAAMIQKLKAKGFKHNVTFDYLEGEFNGRDVEVHVVTNNNKVWRIMVKDKYPTSKESTIKTRFNTLCDQFVKNGKYIPANLTGEYKIDEDEDISVQMEVYNKVYEAVYFQTSENDRDSAAVRKWAEDIVSKKYTEEERENMSEEESQQLFMDLVVEWITERISKKSVWFTISELYGDYSIILYYDNEYNHANGEDL